MSAVLGKMSILLVGFTYRQKKTKKKKRKINIKYSYNTWLWATLVLLFHACLLALSHSGPHERVLPYELWCSVQGRLKAILLCLRHVDTVAFGAWFLCLHGVRRRRKAGSKNQNFVIVILLHMAIRADDTASSLPRRAPPLQSCSPRGWCSPVP